MINFRLLIFVSAILVACVSIILRHDLISEHIGKLISTLFFEQWTDGEKQDLIDSWKKVITPPKTTYNNVLIGLNACLDLIAPALGVLKSMNISASPNPTDHSTIADREQFVDTFSEYFRRGHAAERSVVDKTVFEEFVQSASVNSDSKRSIGGNAALMANIMAERVADNTTITLIGPVGPDLKQLLVEKIRVPDSCHVSRDEVHLILEFAVGDRIGALTAPIANRFIISHDEANTRIAHLPDLLREWSSLRPELVILSGLHMMEALPFDDWKRRIDDLAIGLQTMKNQSSVIHLELASMTDKRRMFIMAEKIFPLVDSLGLNEQELLFLSQTLGGPHASIITSWHHRLPIIGEVADLLVWLLTSFENSRFSRVHFHSLTFHLLASRPTRWTNNAAAVAEGARTASSRACGLKQPKSGLADLRLPRVFRLSELDPGPPTTFVPVQGVLSWSKQNLELAMAPVLVCRRPVQTVGLGDSVSSSGLMMSQVVS